MTYTINYADPLRQTFQINPASYDGPGGTQVNSALRLYGKGALQWGESVDENMLRSLENFASATAPMVPIAGQIWVRQELYWRNTSVVATTPGPAPANAFFRYRFQNGTWNTTNSANPFNVDIVTALPTTGGTIGRYVFNLGDNILYRWDSPYQQAAPQWMPRLMSVEAGTPGAAIPKESMVRYTIDGRWVDAGGGGTGGGGYSTIVPLTNPRPLTITDANTLFRYTSATPATFVLPHSSSVAYPIGTKIGFRQVSTGTVAIEPDNGVTLMLPAGFSSNVSQGKGAEISVTKVSADEWDANGEFAYT